MLRDSELTLQKATSVIRAAESTAAQMREMSHIVDDAKVDMVQKSAFRSKKRVRFPSTPSRSGNNTGVAVNCRKCGTTHKYRECPAYGKQCKQCQGWGHFIAFHKTAGNRSSQDSSHGDEPKEIYFLSQYMIILCRNLV